MRWKVPGEFWAEVSHELILILIWSVWQLCLGWLGRSRETSWEALAEVQAKQQVIWNNCLLVGNKTTWKTCLYCLLSFPLSFLNPFQSGFCFCNFSETLLSRSALAKPSGQFAVFISLGLLHLTWLIIMLFGFWEHSIDFLPISLVFQSVQSLICFQSILPLDVISSDCIALHSISMLMIPTFISLGFIFLLSYRLLFSVVFVTFPFGLLIDLLNLMCLKLNSWFFFFPACFSPGLFHVNKWHYHLLIYWDQNLEGSLSLFLTSYSTFSPLGLDGATSELHETLMR